MNFVDPILANARAAPDAVAAIVGERRLTYAELACEVLARAAMLRAAGLRPGGLVATWFPDPITDLASAIALAAEGVGTYVLSGNGETPMRVCAALGIRTLITSDDAPTGFDTLIRVPGFGCDIRRAAAEHRPVDALDLPWLVRSSSGTTGESKIFVTSHRQAHLRRARYLNVVGIGPGDVFHTLTPMTFGAGRQRVFAALSAGATVLLDPPGHTAPRAVALVRRHRVTHLYCVPMTLELLCEALRRERHQAVEPLVDQIETSSSPVPIELLRAAVGRVARVLTVSYSVSEFGHLSALRVDRPDLAGDGSVGRPLEGVEIGILDAGTLSPVPPGSPGLVAARLRGVPTEVAYRDAVGREVPGMRDGWFIPGDMGRWSAGGELILLGRADDMMIFNGINIFPGEIEAALRTHPAVEEVVAFGIRSSLHHDVPCAAVKLRSEVASSELIDHCNRRIGASRPRRIFRIDEFPRNLMGKVLRRELSALASAVSNVTGEATPGTPDAGPCLDIGPDPDPKR